jgi:hypothetical protein
VFSCSISIRYLGDQSIKALPDRTHYNFLGNIFNANNLSITNDTKEYFEQCRPLNFVE